jgi:hypothetical protein
VRPLDYAIQRLRGVLAEIENLKDEDFPYRHSRLALAEIEKRVQQRLDALLQLTPDDDENVVKSFCNDALEQVFKLLPLLGFIVRSTNVRNSFEIFWPILRLARQVLGNDVKLILSSEWRLSPHVIRPFVDLPGYILLGFPASESGNPLLIPLAGHEFGHTKWQLSDFKQDIVQKIKKQLFTLAEQRAADFETLFECDFNLDDLFVQEILKPPFQLALSQSEETFCDFFGLRLFGESYLHAFAYLLTPGGLLRALTYPSLRERIANLESAANQLKLNIPQNYATWFNDDIQPKCSEKDAFLIDLADQSRQSITSDLLDNVIGLADSANAPIQSISKTEEVKRAFRLMTPAIGVRDLINILAAAWELYYQTDLWSGTVLAPDRLATLNELILKSVEILEFEDRTEMSDGTEGGSNSGST